MALEAVVWIIIIMFGAVIPYVSSIEAVSGVPNCHQSERQALLSFKHHLTDPSDRLSSWVAGGISCCGWHGVVCDNLTGHVLELRLRNPFSNDDYLECQFCEPPFLGGKLDNSLLDLKHLHYLDLSNNYFVGIQVPSFIGSMHSFTYLNLSYAGFWGEIPSHLGNLSNLLSLGIAGSDLQTENLGWLSGLSMLRYLDLSYVMLPDTTDDLQALSALPLLEELHLYNCGISHFPNLVNVNFSNLVTLDLSENNFNGSFPGGLENLTSLKYLDLSHSSISSMFPWFYKFSQLEKLILAENDLQGTIIDDIANLTLLNHLDLSSNDLEGEIPRSLSTMCKLELIDLSGNRIRGNVSEVLSSFIGCASNRLHSISLAECELHGSLSFEIGHFQNLELLDLSDNNISGPLPDSLGQFQNLEQLDLSDNNISGPIPDSLGQFHNLEQLDLSDNRISGPVPGSLGSLNSLLGLDLSGNQLNGALPQALGQLHRLEDLNLDYNSISGSIPDVFGSLNFLVSLDFSSNNLSGTIPESLGSLSSLISLVLFGNKLCGNLPASLGKLIKLQTLDVSFNSLEGLLSPGLFANLTSLRYLYASGNKMQVSPNWILSSQLQGVYLSSWYLGPKFPKWLSSLDNLRNLDISDAGIKDSVPGWFWNKTSQMSYLNMSHNHLHGEIAGSLFYLKTLDLSNNLFYGHIRSLLCAREKEGNSLLLLHLGDNNLFGEIPDCWSNWPSLESIELQNNNLTGSLPKSLGSLRILQYLHLRNNSLSGVLPTSLQNCTELIIFDIAQNKLGGVLPKWIGQRLPNLKILCTGSNYFNGYVPNEFCALSSLIILDMSHNNLSGAIPNCLANFSGMTKKSISDSSFYEFVDVADSNYEEAVILVTKALVLQYSNNLRFMTAIDLSNNSLSGQIPESITNLVALQSLNLSGNYLTGKIPGNMDNMSALESLDISMNRLSGEIPQSMASMTFLSFLNVSFNDLVGRIPTSTQIQGFNASCFKGNKLCGPPVSANCGPGEPAPSKQQEDDNQHHDLEDDELYVSIFLGYVVGLGAVIAPLLYSTAWRHHYFQWVNSVWDRLWVWTVLLFRKRVAEVA